MQGTDYTFKSPADDIIRQIMRKPEMSFPYIGVVNMSEPTVRLQSFENVKNKFFIVKRSSHTFKA